MSMVSVLRPPRRLVRVTADPPRQLLDLVTYALVAVAVLWPTYLVLPVGGINFSATRLLVLFSLVLSAGVSMLSPSAAMAMAMGLKRFWRFYFLFAALFVWQMLCDVSAAEPGPSIALTVIEMIFVFSIFFPVFLCATSTRARQVITVILAVSALIALLVGVYEAITGANISAGIASRSAVSSQIVRAMTLTQIRDGAYRIKSIFSHPILLSQFAGMMLPMFIHLMLQGRRGLLRVMGAAGVVMAPFVILSTVARSGVLVALIAVTGYFGFVQFVHRRIKATTIIAAACAGLLAIGVLGFTAETFQGLIHGRTTIEVSSATSREIMIDKGLDAIQESPILGYGHGQAANYAGLVGNSNLLTIDNYYLSALLDFGYPGLFLTLCVFLEVVLVLTGAVSLAVTPHDRSMISAYAATAAVLVGQYVINSWDNLIYLFIALGVCMGAVTSFDAARSASQQSR